jgi:alpha-amylase/alpha-mannosidase (GH57 family)
VETRLPKYVCIHGHFYQPPRENPWLEYVEYQESAHPFHDWNERIAEECYTPNTQARILDEQGRLRRVVNNYEHISFDFGPTLLSWLEQKCPDTYRRILNADVLSIQKRSGHGNALAQAYNHMIMPLASLRDKVTQTVWAIKDFMKRFQRRPEGMWLPETAVDKETLGVLIDHGISFTILSPWQARRFRAVSGAEWVDVSGGTVDPSRPYKCSVAGSGQITIFFYDAPISQAIAFQHLLNSGEDLRLRLLGGFSDQRTWPQLVHIATDGESYGHHHRFGEMALAFALDRLIQDQDVELTNYAEFLDKHPPTAEVELIEYSSWSCPHGLGRWSRDCGCSSGLKPGWNQRWRAPLRRAMDALRDRADAVFEREARAFLSDPWNARNEYIEVVLANHANAGDFLVHHQTHSLDATEAPLALKLLEMQRNRMLMYTSCGWFFDDITGIESLQVLRYAARTIQLLQPYDAAVLDDFLSILSQAESNTRSNPRGDEIFNNKIWPQASSLEHVAAHVVISAAFEELPIREKLYCYNVEVLDLVRERSVERVFLLGRLKVADQVTLQSSDFICAVIYLGEVDLRCSVKNFVSNEEYATLKKELLSTFYRYSSTELLRQMDKRFSEEYFSMKNLFVEQRIRIIEAATSKMYEEQAGLFEVFYRTNKDLAKLIVTYEAKLPDTFLAAARFVLSRTFLRELEKLSGGFYPDRLESVLEEARFWKIQLDVSSAEKLIRGRIMELMKQLGKNPWDASVCLEILKFLDLGTNLEIKLELGQAQIEFFMILQELWAAPQRGFPPNFPELADRLSVRLEKGPNNA